MNVGDKVKIPVKKSYGLSLINSDILAEIEENDVNYLFITRIEPNGVCMVDVEFNSGTGYLFAEEDLEPYNPAETALEMLKELQASMNKMNEIIRGI